MNKAILMGRLTKDPEVRYSQASEPLAIARYTLAVNRRFKRDGEPDADFIPCVAFGKTAEFAERFFKKGMMITISGRIQVRSWDDQSGQKRWSTEVVVEEQDFAESKSSFESRNTGGGNYNEPSRGGGNYSEPPRGGGKSYEQDGFSAITEPVDDEDLPF